MTSHNHPQTRLPHFEVAEENYVAWFLFCYSSHTHSFDFERRAKRTFVYESSLVVSRFFFVSCFSFFLSFFSPWFLLIFLENRSFWFLLNNFNELTAATCVLLVPQRLPDIVFSAQFSCTCFTLLSISAIFTWSVLEFVYVYFSNGCILRQILCAV